MEPLLSNQEAACICSQYFPVWVKELQWQLGGDRVTENFCLSSTVLPSFLFCLGTRDYERDSITGSKKLTQGPALCMCYWIDISNYPPRGHALFWSVWCSPWTIFSHWRANFDNRGRNPWAECCLSGQFYIQNWFKKDDEGVNLIQFTFYFAIDLGTPSQRLWMQTQLDYWYSIHYLWFDPWVNQYQWWNLQQVSAVD